MHVEAPAYLLLASVGPSHGGPSLGLTLFIILATAGVVALLFRKLRLETIPGYLIAGALVGPHALGLVPGGGGVEQVSDLAIVLLLFTIGLHLDVSTLQRGMVHILGVGVASTIAFAGVFWSLLLVLGVPRPNGLAIALAASISSTAVLVRTLMSRRELQSAHGRVTLGVSIVQDLASVVILAMLPLIAAWAGIAATDAAPDPHLARGLFLFAQGAKAVGGVFLLLIAGRVVVPRLLNAIAGTGSQELVLVTSAALALAAAWWTSFVGFSAEMGAFLAGFMLGTTPYRYQLSGQLAPLRDLLMAIFFTVVGMQVHAGEIASNWLVILAAVVGVVLFKTLAVGGSAYLAGMTAPSALIAGIYLANAGEFTLVILSAAHELGVVSDRQQGSAIAVVILTLVTTSLVIAPVNTWARALARVPLSPWIRGAALRDAPPPPPLPGDSVASVAVEEGASTDPAGRVRPRHVIIGGFGPVGRSLADRFSVMGVDVTVIELNAATVQRQALIGRRVLYGDAANHEVLEQAGVRWADAVILTIPDDEAVLRACQAIRELSPHVFLAARTNFLSGKVVALQLGADVVTVSEIATATAMEKEVLDALVRRLSSRKEPLPTDSPAGAH